MIIKVVHGGEINKLNGVGVSAYLSHLFFLRVRHGVMLVLALGDGLGGG